MHARPEMPHENELSEIIREEIERMGPMNFARYMALALYHPTLGYYVGGSQGREPVGWSGDYFTSGDLHPLWGWCVARQLHQMWELVGRPVRFDVIEPGAGRGLLARETWRYALEQAPDWAAALHYTLVDRVPADVPLRLKRAEQLGQELSALGASAEGVRWVSEVAEAGVGLVGCVVSNELVDALPVHVVEARGGVLREVYVALEGGRLVETLDVSSSPEVADYLDHFRIPWRGYPDGWRAEVCLEAGAWLQNTAAVLRRGFTLTIDYGDTARRLYTRDRYRGTLAVYARHQFGGEPLARPGRQDLTAHVNFSALVEAGRAVELRLVGMTTQGEFLRRLGIEEELAALTARLYPAADTERHTDRGQADYLRRMSQRNAIAALLDPRGLGGFRLLAQQRGVPGAGRALRGFSG